MSKEYWANLIFSVFLACIVIVAVAGLGSALTPKGLFVQEPSLTSETKKMLSNVFLTRSTSIKDINRRVKTEFHVRNASQQDVENLTVLCDFFDDNGSFVDRKEWFLGAVFPAGKETSVAPPQERYLNTGATKDCRIVDLHIVKAPAFTLHRPENGGHGSADSSEGGHEPKSSSH